MGDRNIIHRYGNHRCVRYRRRILEKQQEKKITVEFTEEELNIIHDVFDELTGESLRKWTTLIPEHGEYRSTECFQQWLTTGKFDRIRRRSRIALGLEKELTEEEVKKQLDEAEKMIAVEVFRGILE